MEEKKPEIQKLETISNKIIEYCIKNGLTISEMNDLTIVFPNIARKKILAFENATAFTLDFVQDDSKS